MWPGREEELGLLLGWSCLTQISVTNKCEEKPISAKKVKLLKRSKAARGGNANEDGSRAAWGGIWTRAEAGLLGVGNEQNNLLFMTHRLTQVNSTHTKNLPSDVISLHEISAIELRRTLCLMPGESDISPKCRIWYDKCKVFHSCRSAFLQFCVVSCATCGLLFGYRFYPQFNVS